MTSRCKPGNESMLVVVDSTTDVWISTGKAARLLDLETSRTTPE